ncbi:MAG: hypothetical protein CM1200mP3_08790 [Chloroflexota bacterium]|nr:MAG: hypothetical protein CM1200mP3_08790 [Chloroflexota bacterium]
MLPSAAVRNLVMDTREGSVFHEKKCREKAIQYAIDRDFVRKAVTYGYGANANDHPIGQLDPMYWADQPVINQDIELSRSYLKAAGYDASNPLEVENRRFRFQQYVRDGLGSRAVYRSH